MPVQGIDANILTSGNAMASSNPIEMISRLAATQNMMNQNALFQQQYKARSAMGPLAQQSVGPDGKMDWDKFATLISSHPDTAWMAPDVLNQIAQKKLIDAQTTNVNLKTKSESMQMLGNNYLAASNDSKVNNIGDFVSQGYASTMHEINSNFSGDPKALVTFLGNPKWAQMTGQDFRDGMRNLGYAHMQGGLGLQATSNAFGTLGYTPSGDTVYGWHSQYGQKASPLLGPMTQQQAASAGPTTGAAAINAAGGGGGSGPAAPAPQPAPSWTPGAPGPQREETFKYGAKLDDAAQYATTFLNNIKAGEQLLNRAATGRAIPTRLEIGRWAKSAGLDENKVDAVVGGNVDMTQALGKLMLMLGTQSMRQANEGNAAVRSVQEWQKFIEANPNPGNDPGAIRKMWHQMKFQARLIQSEQAHYSDWRDSGKDILGFRPAWNQHVNEATNDYLKSVQDRDWDQPTAVGE